MRRMRADSCTVMSSPRTSCSTRAPGRTARTTRTWRTSASRSGVRADRARGNGHLLGTIDYVAPEQIAGEEVDGRADVYSLGCVLFECLAGWPPFRRDREVAVVYAHLQEEPPLLSERRPECRKALDAVIARSLAKEPEQRYASCRELARAALGVTVDEASRRLAEVASRAAAGRSDLSRVETELAGKVIDLQLAREQARALARPSTPSRVAARGVCPFKGLASFEPADADYFFGRERLIAELVARLVGPRFSASSARRGAASRRCCAPGCCRRSPVACCRAASAGGAC